MRYISKILVLVLAAGIPIAAFAAAPPSPFLLRHGTIVDPARGAAYVAKPNGTIDSVDLASGRTLWTSADAALPLGADQDLLVAQVEEKPWPTERFRVVILDVAGGWKVSEATLPLPAGGRGRRADHAETDGRRQRSPASGSSALDAGPGGLPIRRPAPTARQRARGGGRAGRSGIPLGHLRHRYGRPRHRAAARRFRRAV